MAAAAAGTHHLINGPSSLAGEPSGSRELVRRLTRIPVRVALLPFRLVLVPLRSVATVLLDTVETLVCRATSATALARASPFLRCDWLPQPDAVRTSPAPVVFGALPPELDGAFVRVGPNPSPRPITPGHLFDGDGAAAVFRIENGNASFSWTMVQTEKLLREKGRVRVPQIGSMRGFFGLFHLLLFTLRSNLRLVDYNHSTANTALVVHSQRLLALQEGNMPYALRILCDGAMETIGRLRFSNAPSYDEPFSAHPKKHPTNGCLYAVSYKLEAKTAPVFVQVVTATGSLARSFPITSISRPIMVHDAALTERYVVVMDLPLVFDPEKMVRDGSLPIVFDSNAPARFGLISVDAEDDSKAQWFEFEKPFYVFHTACAHDEGSSVVIWACTMDDFDLSLKEQDYDSRPADVSHFTKFVLDTTTGKATRQDFDMVPFGKVRNYDFPQVDPSLVSTGARYCYLLGYDSHPHDRVSPVGGHVGLVKFDMSKGREVGRLRFKSIEGRATGFSSGGEAVFVPREKQCSEDDGYLTTIVYDYNKGRSALHVYDAKTMDAEPVAIVDAPIRVPAGFHATFVPLQMLRSLSASL